jgi:MTH538 TIR-like domain (DUF1863)
MAYRNGTYIAFYADGNKIPGGKSDIDYYNLLCAWNAHRNHEFNLVNSHEKASAIRDSSKKSTLRASLLERLRNSKNMLLIIGETTRYDTDWVPFEIEKAVDAYQIPIIVGYTVFTNAIRNPKALSAYWPTALKTRIEKGTASAIHVPFKQAPLNDAIDQFSHRNLPKGDGLGIYHDEAYASWGIS